MDNITKKCRRYIDEYLTKIPQLADYLSQATIILNCYENDGIWDLMILIENELYQYEFSQLYGEYFVVDDHKHNPPVFTRVKSYAWLKEDIRKRLPVALWIFSHAIVIQEQTNEFSKIINEFKTIFQRNLTGIIRRKYLEMRTERHNLRYSVQRHNNIENILLKAKIVKLCLELSLLAINKPYPFNILLPDYARSQSAFGRNVYNIATEFLNEIDPKKIIDLSDLLIEQISSALKETGNYSENFLSQWWLFLD